MILNVCCGNLLFFVLILEIIYVSIENFKIGKEEI